MAKNIYSAQTMTQGKVGGLVYKIVMGKQVVMPLVIPANPNTEAQQLYRARLVVLGKLAMRGRYAIRIGTKAYGKKTKKGMVGAFVDLNQEALTGTSASNLQLSVNKLKFSEGSNMPVEFDSNVAVTDSTAVIRIGYNYAEDYPDTAQDKVYALCYCPDHNMVVMGTPVVRTAERVNIHLPSIFSGSECSFYGFTVAPDGTASETRFIKTMEID